MYGEFMLDINIPNSIIKATFSGKKDKNQPEEKAKIERIIIKNAILFFIYLAP